MDWRDIPERVLIGPPGAEEPWSVVWRSCEDRTWTQLGCVGFCYFDGRTIHLDERLKNDPTELFDTWVHELQHAAYRYWDKVSPKKRPKAFDDKVEEEVITVVSPILARALAQTKRSSS